MIFLQRKSYFMFFIQTITLYEDSECWLYVNDEFVIKQLQFSGVIIFILDFLAIAVQYFSLFLEM